MIQNGAQASLPSCNRGFAEMRYRRHRISPLVGLGFFYLCWPVDHLRLHQRGSILLAEPTRTGGHQQISTEQSSRYVIDQISCACTDRGSVDVERALGVSPPETVSISPEKSLYEACRKMLRSRARRIPLISEDSQTGRTMVTSVLTQYRILKFVAVNVGDTQNLRKPLRDIRLGTFREMVTCSMDTLVIEVIHEMVKRSISSVPILTAEGEHLS